MKNKHFYFFVGTMAEYIKLAPVIKEFKDRKIKFKIILSGQNRIDPSLLSDYYGEVKANIKFQEKAVKSSIPFFGLWALKTLYFGRTKLNKEFKNKDKNNTYFIIHGDTVSSLLGSIIAKFYGLKIVQVESGLRSFHFLEPFPEEICRYIISHLADVMFPPTTWAKNNLKKYKKAKIINTHENTLSEICLWAVNKNKKPEIIKKGKKFYILSTHRQEHVYFNKDQTRNTLDFIIRNSNKNLKCVILMHSLTSRFLKSERLNFDKEISKNIIFVPTMPYFDFMALMSNAEYIATDSCTNQEEAYYMGLPYLGLRNRTERIEGLKENVVIAKHNKNTMKHFLRNYKKFKRPKIKLSKKPSKIVVDYLLKH